MAKWIDSTNGSDAICDNWSHVDAGTEFPIVFIDWETTKKESAIISLVSLALGAMWCFGTKRYCEDMIGHGTLQEDIGTVEDARLTKVYDNNTL
jgi:hypothetical protein